MANKDNFLDLQINEKEFIEAVELAERMHNAITPKWIKSTMRRNLRPMVSAMKSASKSTRIAKMIGVTTAVKRAGPMGAKVGITRNNAELFPDIRAQALASIIEYGVSKERFRQLTAGAVVTGRQSTGTMPAAPFLRPSWDAHVGAFMAATEDSIDKKIMSEA